MEKQAIRIEIIIIIKMRINANAFVKIQINAEQHKSKLTKMFNKARVNKVKRIILH